MPEPDMAAIPPTLPASLAAPDSADMGAITAAGGERHVFVYGTLRRDSVRDINQLRPAPRWVGWARVQGRLFHLGAYPGLLLDIAEAPWVLGEVYAIEPALERLLDEIEEVLPQPTGEYVKRQVRVELLPHGLEPGSIAWDQIACTGTLSCLLYEVDISRTWGQPRLPSGDWMRP